MSRLFLSRDIEGGHVWAGRRKIGLRGHGVEHSGAAGGGRRVVEVVGGGGSFWATSSPAQQQGGGGDRVCGAGDELALTVCFGSREEPRPESGGGGGGGGLLVRQRSFDGRTEVWRGRLRADGRALLQIQTLGSRCGVRCVLCGGRFRLRFTYATSGLVKRD
eukprot:COSAG01_NODE_9024_length_2579_cov_4.843145_2_plen_162_part_00